MGRGGRGQQDGGPSKSTRDIFIETCQGAAPSRWFHMNSFCRAVVTPSSSHQAAVVVHGRGW